MKGFREFILRGNVIDLAVAVVVGAAFTGVVNSLVNGVLNPAIGALFNAKSLETLWVIDVSSPTGEPAKILLGSVLAALIQFLLVAIVVYFALILPINYLKKRAFKQKEEGTAPTPAAPNEVDLLIEIRDLLKARDVDSTPQA
jgi:large conductance mechanosensitive channel